VGGLQGARVGDGGAERAAKIKGELAEHFLTEILTTEAAQDEMTGLTQGLKTEQQHHEIKTSGNLRRCRLCDREDFKSSRTGSDGAFRADAS
jgi:hypothetical protein